jgi:hypothetical protein
LDCGLGGDFVLSDAGASEDAVLIDAVAKSDSGGGETQIAEGSLSTTIFDGRASAVNDASELDVSEGMLGIGGARMPTASKFSRWRRAANGVLNLGDVWRPSGYFDLGWASLGRSWAFCGEPLLAPLWSAMMRARRG